MSLVQFAKFHGGTSAFAFYKSGRISRQKIVNFFLERIMMISLTLLLLKSNNSYELQLCLIKLLCMYSFFSVSEAHKHFLKVIYQHMRLHSCGMYIQEFTIS